MLRADVIVVDDIGLLPVTEEAAEGLYRLVDAAYERRSIAISSNLHPSGFDQLMPPSLATALVDRPRTTPTWSRPQENRSGSKMPRAARG